MDQSLGPRVSFQIGLLEFGVRRRCSLNRVEQLAADFVVPLQLAVELDQLEFD